MKEQLEKIIDDWVYERAESALKDFKEDLDRLVAEMRENNEPIGKILDVVFMCGYKASLLENTKD